MGMTTRERVARAIAELMEETGMFSWERYLPDADAAIAAMLKTKAPKPRRDDYADAWDTLIYENGWRDGIAAYKREIRK